MDENEKKIRKYWLATPGGSVLITHTAIFFQQKFSASMHTAPIPEVARYVGIAFSSLGTLLIAFLLYRCAYKKPGTKLLTFGLVISGLSFLSTPLFYLTGKLQPALAIPYYGTLILLTQVTNILWVILCWKMRKINKKLQSAAQAHS